MGVRRFVRKEVANTLHDAVKKEEAQQVSFGARIRKLSIFLILLYLSGEML